MGHKAHSSTSISSTFLPEGVCDYAKILMHFEETMRWLKSINSSA